MSKEPLVAGDALAVRVREGGGEVAHIEGERKELVGLVVAQQVSPCQRAQAHVAVLVSQVEIVGDVGAELQRLVRFPRGEACGNTAHGSGLLTAVFPVGPVDARAVCVLAAPFARHGKVVADGLRACGRKIMTLRVCLGREVNVRRVGSRHRGQSLEKERKAQSQRRERLLMR